MNPNFTMFRMNKLPGFFCFLLFVVVCFFMGGGVQKKGRLKEVFRLLGAFIRGGGGRLKEGGHLIKVLRYMKTNGS